MKAWIDSASAATDIHDALLDMNGTRLTHVQENIDNDNSAPDIDPVPFALQSASTYADDLLTSSASWPLRRLTAKSTVP